MPRPPSTGQRTYLVPVALTARQRPGLPCPNRGKRFPPEPLTAREALALIGKCSPTAMTGIRDRAMIAVLYRSGLRSAECLALYPKDVDRDNGAISVLRGKGNKRRTVGLDPGTVALLERWLDVRAGRGFSWRQPLFCTIRPPNPGRAVSGSYLRQKLPKLAEKAGIGKRVHPHGLRHTHAYELHNEGVPLTVIQKQLGHSHLATTAIYLDHFSPQLVLATMRARSWGTLEEAS